jgi:hypothetical protein
MLFKNFLEGSFSQGEWVTDEKFQGIFIAKISQNESIIACYNDQEKKYLKINNGTIKKCEGKNDELLSFAKRHILWHHKDKFDRRGSRDKEALGKRSPSH